MRYGRPVAYTLTFLVLIGFLVYAILDTKHANKVSKSKPPRTEQLQSPPNTPGVKSAPPTPAPSSSETQATAKPQADSPANGSKLANTGPGDTAVLFFTAALAGTAVAYGYQLKTSQKLNLDV